MSNPIDTPAWRQWLAPALIVMGVYFGMQWWQGRQGDETGKQLAALARPGDIVMYSTDTCVYCHRAMDQLEAWGVTYTECDIDRDLPCAQAYQSAGSPGTPLMNVRGQWQLGFSAPGVLQALQQPAPRR